MIKIRAIKIKHLREEFNFKWVTFLSNKGKNSILVKIYAKIERGIFDNRGEKCMDATRGDSNSHLGDSDPM